MCNLMIHSAVKFWMNTVFPKPWGGTQDGPWTSFHWAGRLVQQNRTKLKCELIFLIKEEKLFCFFE